jgi:hypothetical protein
VGQPKAARLQRQLQAQLQSKLSADRDAFGPADTYIRKWAYHMDATGTVPYQP